MFHSTTIIAVRKGDRVIIAGDGQVSMGQVVVKSNANKVRKLGGGRVIAGFAGATADAFLLFDLFEKTLETYDGQFLRSAVELAKSWRSDKMLRRLEALLLIANVDQTLVVSGAGDVIEPESDVYAIGSGGFFALASAKALIENTNLDARSIARKALKIASSMCVYTNDSMIFEELLKGERM